MPVLSNTTLWRTKPSYGDGYLYILNPDVVVSRRVNQTSFNYPLVEVAYDNPDGDSGDIAEIEIGMLVKISDSSGNLKNYARIKTTPSLTKFFIGAVSQNEIDFENDDIIEVLNDFRIQSKIPFIDDNGTLYKDYNIPYINQNLNQHPVANAGEDVCDFVDVSNELLVTLDGTNSFSVASGSSISSYQWDIKDGTLEAGYSLTDSLIEVTFPSGYRYVSLTVTDSNSETHTHHCLIVALTENDVFKARINSLEGDVDNGWNGSFQLLENADFDTVPQNTRIVFIEKETYGATQGSLNGFELGRYNIKFNGWVLTDSSSIEPYYSELVINAVNAHGILQNLPAFSQTLERVASPSAWFEMASLNWWRYAHYLLYWHTTLFEVCNIERPSYYTSFDVVRLDATEGSVVDQMNFACEAIAAKFTIGRNNQVLFRKQPQIMTDTERNLLTETLQLEDSDWINQITFEQQNRDTIASVQGSAIVASSSVVTAVLSASGKIPSQGTGRENLQRQLVASQDDLNFRTGRRYALRNQKNKSIRLDIVNRGIVVDPAWQEKITFNSTINNKRNFTFSNKDYIVKRVSVSFDIENGVNVEQWELQELVSSVDGVTLPVPTNEEGGGGYDDQYTYDFDIPEIFIPPYLDDIGVEPDNEVVAGIAFAVDNDGSNLLLTENRDENEITWSSIYTPPDNYFISYASPQHSSPYYLDKTAELGLFLILNSSNPTPTVNFSTGDVLLEGWYDEKFSYPTFAGDLFDLDTGNYELSIETNKTDGTFFLCNNSGWAYHCRTITNSAVNEAVFEINGIDEIEVDTIGVQHRAIYSASGNYNLSYQLKVGGIWQTEVLVSTTQPKNTNNSSSVTITPTLITGIRWIFQKGITNGNGFFVNSFWVKLSDDYSGGGGGTENSGLYYNPDVLGVGTFSQINSSLTNYRVLRNPLFEPESIAMWNGSTVAISLTATSIDTTYNVGANDFYGFDVAKHSSASAVITSNGTDIVTYDSLSGSSPVSMDYITPLGTLETTTAIFSPNKIWLDNTKNDDSTALDFAVCTTENIYLITGNVNTGSMEFQVDRSIANYHVFSEDGFSQPIADSQKMVAIVTPNVSGDTRLYFSEDAGENWNVIATKELQFVKHSANSSFWVAGSDGIFNTYNDGNTLNDKTGNLIDFSDNGAKVVFPI